MNMELAIEAKLVLILFKSVSNKAIKFLLFQIPAKNALVKEPQFEKGIYNQPPLSQCPFLHVYCCWNFSQKNI